MLWTEIGIDPLIHLDNNRKSMLRQTNKKKNVTYNVMPTLLAIGQSANVTPDVQRHVVRAIDNLSNQGKKMNFCIWILGRDSLVDGITNSQPVWWGFKCSYNGSEPSNFWRRSTVDEGVDEG